MSQLVNETEDNLTKSDISVFDKKETTQTNGDTGTLKEAVSPLRLPPVHHIELELEKCVFFHIEDGITCVSEMSIE